MAGSNSSLTALWRSLCDMKRYVPVFAIAFVLIGAVIVVTSMHQYWLKEGLAVIWTDDIDALSDEICDDADNDKADMLSKFEIALKECSETEGWLKLLFNTNAIDENTYKMHRNLCGRIRRILISSCKTLKENNK